MFINIISSGDKNRIWQQAVLTSVFLWEEQSIHSAEASPPNAENKGTERRARGRLAAPLPHSRALAVCTCSFTHSATRQAHTARQARSSYAGYLLNITEAEDSVELARNLGRDLEEEDSKQERWKARKSEGGMCLLGFRNCQRPGLVLSERGGSGDDIREVAGPGPSPELPTPYLVALFHKSQSLAFSLADSPEGRSAQAPFGLASEGQGLTAVWSSRALVPSVPGWNPHTATSCASASLLHSRANNRC